MDTVVERGVGIVAPRVGTAAGAAGIAAVGDGEGDSYHLVPALHQDGTLVVDLTRDERVGRRVPVEEGSDGRAPRVLVPRCGVASTRGIRN